MDKCLPLSILLSIVIELRRQSHWWFIRDGCATRFKRGLNGFAERGTVKCKFLTNGPHIKEVFHPGIEHSEFDHSFKLLRNHAFTGVTLKVRRRKIKQCWEIDLLRSRHNRIPEADVDLQTN